jgi:hypothetical protein
MKRYILLNSAGGDASEAVARLESIEGARIVDRTNDRALLVEASLQAIDRIAQALPGWKVAPEASLAKPEPPFPRPSWDFASPEAPSDFRPKDEGEPG